MFLGIVTYNESVIAHWIPSAPHQHWWCLCWELCSHGIIMRETCELAFCCQPSHFQLSLTFCWTYLGFLWQRNTLYFGLELSLHLFFLLIVWLSSNQPTLLCLKLYLENRANSSYKVAVKILIYLWEIPLKLWVLIDYYYYHRDYYEVDYTWMYNFKWLKKKKRQAIVSYFVKFDYLIEKWLLIFIM